MKSKKVVTNLNSLRVTSKNNQVFIKKDLNTNNWYPVNFQWVPIVKFK